MDDEDMDSRDRDMDRIYTSAYLSRDVIGTFIQRYPGQGFTETKLEELKEMLRQFLFNDRDGQVTQCYNRLSEGDFNNSLKGEGKTLLNEMFNNLFHEQFNRFLSPTRVIPQLTNADDLRDSADDLRDDAVDLRDRAFNVSDAMIGLCKDLVDYEKTVVESDNNENVSKPGFINYIMHAQGGTEKKLFEEGKPLHFYVKPHKTVGGRRPQKSKSRKRRQSSKKKRKQTKKKRVRKRRTNKSKRKQTTKK